MTLHVAPGLDLGDDLVTKTVGILAQRRKGKTYTASVIAEEMVAAGIPFVALDPTGAWWGLRASADGKKDGLPVTIFGGHHGDIPLERSAGREIADVVIDQPGWYVIDMALFENKAADREFATDFATRLYRRKGQDADPTPLHVFVDEADVFVPQVPGKDGTTMLGAFETLVRRGGIRGIGTTLISQRSAVVNKNVLEMVDLMIVLRTVGPNDRSRIEDIVEAAGTKEQVKELMNSVASLDLGEAWFWEPGEGLFERHHVRARHTFNSSATPKAGEKRAEPRKLAPVDLDALKERMAATIEKADATDPKKLQARIRELEGKCVVLERERDAALAATPEPVVETVEVERLVPVIPEEAIKLVGAFMETVRTAVLDAADELKTKFEAVAPPAAAKSAGAVVAPRPPAPPRRAPAHPTRASGQSFADPDAGSIGGGAPRDILTVLARHHPTPRTRRQVATEARLAAKKSTIRNALSALRTRGLIVETGDTIHITNSGLAAAGPIEQLPTGGALIDWWRAELGTDSAPRRAFETLLLAGAAVTRAELTASTGADGSTLRNALSKLRGYGLITDGNPVSLTPEFLEAIA